MTAWRHAEELEASPPRTRAVIEEEIYELENNSYCDGWSCDGWCGGDNCGPDEEELNALRLELESKPCK